MRWCIAFQVLVVAMAAIGAGLIHAFVSPQRAEIEVMVPSWYHQGEIAARKRIEKEQNNGEINPSDNKQSVTSDGNQDTDSAVSSQNDFDLNTLNEDVSLDEAKQLWDRQLVTFVDARDYEIYKLGHIKDAISIPYDVIRDMNDIPPHVKNGIIEPGQTPLVIYCKGGDCDESLLVAGELRGMGFKCFIFYDGFPAWRQAEYPIDNGPDPFLVDFNEEPQTDSDHGG